MHTIVLRLDPQRLANPDLDLRYSLPDLLIQRSDGLLIDDGYDYAGDAPFLLLFLQTTDLERALACILDVVEHQSVLENNLQDAVVIAVERDGEHEVVYPLGFHGTLLPAG